MSKSLTARQKKFVDEYLVDLNATQAAIRAGYSEKTAMEQGYQLLQKPSVRDAISAGKREVSEATRIDAGYVLQRTVEYLDMCAGRTPIKKAIVSDGVTESIDVKEFNQAGYGKALELLGKHVEIGAFKDRLEVNATISHEDALELLK